MSAKTIRKVKLFPFRISDGLANEIMIDYVLGLKREHGENAIEKVHGYHWSWYSPTGRMLSPTQIEITTYEMLSLCNGGRGEKKDVFTFTFPAKKYADVVYRRQMEFAQGELLRREEEARQRQIELIRQEMFDYD